MITSPRDIVIGTVIFILIIMVLKVAKIKLEKIIYRNKTLVQVDAMKGLEFEEYLLVLFKDLGYKASRTKGSGDFGVDLILKKDNRVIAVQAKRYKSKVNLKAVQEVVAGSAFYNASESWVVTNSFFTDSAKALAKANTVKLIDRKELKALIKRRGNN